MTDDQIIERINALTRFITDSHAEITAKSCGATGRLVSALENEAGYECNTHIAASSLRSASTLMREQAHRLGSLADEFDTIAARYE